MKQTSTIKTECDLLISEFLNTINEPLVSTKKLNGGTQNKVFLINQKYIFKINSADKLKLEHLYNITYSNQPISQQMVFCDKNCRFIVYKYVEGGEIEHVHNPRHLVRYVNRFISHYKPYTHLGYGDINLPHLTWTEFLTQLIADSVPYLQQVITQEQINYVLSQIPVLDNYAFTKKLLHGDLRLSNVIYKNGKVNGIIDPYPMIGDPLYDQLFFIFSTPEITNVYNLKTLYKAVKQPKQKVNILSLIVVCVKIKRIIKYNTEMEKLPFYLSALEILINQK